MILTINEGNYNHSMIIILGMGEHVWHTSVALFVSADRLQYNHSDYNFFAIKYNHSDYKFFAIQSLWSQNFVIQSLWSSSLSWLQFITIHCKIWLIMARVIIMINKHFVLVIRRALLPLYNVFFPPRLTKILSLTKSYCHFVILRFNGCDYISGFKIPSS